MIRTVTSLAAFALAIASPFSTTAQTMDYLPAADDGSWKVAFGSPRLDSSEPEARFCLGHESGGRSRRGVAKWILLPYGDYGCREGFVADLDRKVIFLAMPDLLNSQKRHYCGPRIEEGYGPCSSAFFDPLLGPDRSYRLLNTSRLVAALAEARAAGGLEEMIAARDAATVKSALKATATERAAKLAEYRERYTTMRSAAELRLFILDYANDDPDGEVPHAKARYVALEREAFGRAQTAEELETFVGTYRALDSGDFIPAAETRLSKMKAERALRDRREGALLNIRSCKRTILDAQSELRNQQRIATLSGVQNRAVMYNAGAAIAACEDLIASNYRVYKQTGGTLALEALTAR